MFGRKIPSIRNIAVLSGILLFVPILLHPLKMLTPPDYRKIACEENNGIWNNENAQCEFANPQKDKCVRLAQKYLLEKYPEISGADYSMPLVLSYANNISMAEYQIEQCITKAEALKRSLLDPYWAEIGEMSFGTEKDLKWKELHDYYLKSMYEVDAECKKRYPNSTEKVWDIGYHTGSGVGFVITFRVIVSEYHCDLLEHSKSAGISHPDFSDGCSGLMQ